MTSTVVDQSYWPQKNDGLTFNSQFMIISGGPNRYQLPSVPRSFLRNQLLIGEEFLAGTGVQLIFKMGTMVISPITWDMGFLELWSSNLLMLVKQ